MRFVLAYLANFLSQESREWLIQMLAIQQARAQGKNPFI